MSPTAVIAGVLSRPAGDLSQSNATVTTPSSEGDLPVGVLFTPLYILTVFLLVILSMSGLCTCLCSMLTQCRIFPRTHALLSSSNNSTIQKMKLDESQLQAIGEFSFEDIESSDVCTICMNLLKHEEICRTMPPECCHTFHKVCIDEWFVHASHCPLCKRSIPELLQNLSAPTQKENSSHMDEINSNITNGSN